MLATCQRVAAIPAKRTAPPETGFLERDEVEDLLRHLPRDGRLALRDRAMLLFLYNTGARVQEAQPTCAPGTSTSASTRSSGCTAKATSGGPARCGSRQPPCSAT